MNILQMFLESYKIINILKGFTLFVIFNSNEILVTVFEVMKVSKVFELFKVNTCFGVFKVI